MTQLNNSHLKLDNYGVFIIYHCRTELPIRSNSLANLPIEISINHILLSLNVQNRIRKATVISHSLLNLKEWARIKPTTHHPLKWKEPSQLTNKQIYEFRCHSMGYRATNTIIQDIRLSHRNKCRKLTISRLKSSSKVQQPITSNTKDIRC
jgi:hypothetical protein